MNIAQMMKQAQQMQKKLQDVQAELAATEVTATSGNGAVTVVLDGHGKFKSIKLRPEAVNPENPSSVDEESLEMLEELISSALKEASEEATKKSELKMKGIVPPGLHIPGLI